MRAVCTGDEAAFNRLFDRYSPRVYRFALWLTRGDEALSKDLHQVTFVRAAQKLKVFDNEQQLWAWLCRITRNAHLDHVRRGSIFQRILRRLNRDEAEEPVVDGFHESLEKSLGKLDAEEMALIELVYFKRKSQAEAAALLGKSVKAVERKLARTREQLKSFILEELRDEK